MRLIINMVLLLIFVVQLSGQREAQLAQHYYSIGEYEKAATMFKKLSDEAGYHEYYFNQYVESMLSAGDYDGVTKEIMSTLNKRPDLIQLYVSYGLILERQGKGEEAQDQFRKAIQQTGSDLGRINALGNSFTNMTKYDLAEEVLLKGEKIVGNKTYFSHNLAEIYRRKNNVDKMVEYFLASPTATIERLNSVQNYFSRYLYDDGDYDILLRQALSLSNADPDNIFYAELIQWVYITQKKYDRALRQARALDRRLDEDGHRVYNIAQISQNDRDFTTAINAFEYIIEDKGQRSRYYIDAKKEVLKTRRRLISSSNDDSSYDKYKEIRKEYIAFLDELGRGRETALMILELAELEALHLNDLQAAITTLHSLLQLPGVNNYIRANAKLDMGDYYLMSGEIWDATLLYSQVDKDFKEDFLGERARFKNAMLSYYNGDFDWAQEQLDILKTATSRLISNDAIDKSVFIMDHANLDTSYEALGMFAKAELLLYQNRDEEAYAILRKLMKTFPGHSLESEVLFLKAERAFKARKFPESINLYEQIISDYADGIRADNSLYALAQIYDLHLDEEQKAMEFYERIFIDYSDSTFSVDARKRYRQLRGDNIQ